MTECRVADPAIVTDRLIDGRLTLRQRRGGHRAGTDAVLLAAAVRIEPGDVMIDVGAGVGTVGLALALRSADLSGTLLEQDPEAADLAAQNCRLNGAADRLRVAVCDLFDPNARRTAGIAGEAATLVVTNPPFHAGAEARMSPDPGKARAHHLRPGDGGHAAWLRAALSLLAPGGRFYAIHRPEVLPVLLPVCEGRLGGLAIMPVYAKAEGAAIRILLSGVKGSRGPLRFCSPLVLHGPDGAFTPKAQALHRGADLLHL